MDIDTASRNDVTKQITKILGDKIAKDVETSIYNFSKEFIIIIY